MSSQSKLMANVIFVPVNTINQTSTTVSTNVALHTVGAGKSYTLTSLDIYSDAPSTAPVLIQIQIAGIVLYSAYVHSLTPLHWSNSNLDIQAAAGNLVQVVLAKTSSVQNVAVNAGQYEY